MILYNVVGDTTEYLYPGANTHGGALSGETWLTPYTNLGTGTWK
jgi:hypothetical protein